MAGSLQAGPHSYRIARKKSPRFGRRPLLYTQPRARKQHAPGNMRHAPGSKTGALMAPATRAGLRARAGAHGSRPPRSVPREHLVVEMDDEDERDDEEEEEDQAHP